MRLLETLREHPRRVELVAVGGLLAAIVFVGLVGLFLNQRIEHVTGDALRYDIELEARSNDLRAAVLDLGYSHRNLTTAGPSRGGIASLEQDYATLQQSIDSLEALGVRSSDAPRPEQLRALAEDYYSKFRPALEDPGPEFTQASDQGLVKLSELERDARDLHDLSQSLAQAELEQAKAATNTAQAALIAVIGGLLAVGAILAYLAVRTVEDLRDLYSRQTEISGNLARSEVRYRHTFENAAVGIAHFGLDGAFLRVNYRLCEMVGYTRDELLATDWMSISHPGELDLNLRLRQRHFRGETESYSLQKRYIHKQGREVWINLTASLMRGESGEPLYYIAFVEDISARKRAEDALRRSETFARTTIDSLSAHVAILDESGNIIAVNRAWRKFAGTNAGREDLGASENYLEVCNSARGPGSEEAAAFAEGIRSVMAGRRESFVMEYPCHSPDEQRWFVGRVTRFNDTEPRRAVIAHENVTERKQIEEALRDSEERYRLLFEGNPHPMWVYDLQTLSFLAINEAASHHYGYSREEFLAMTIEDIRPPEDVPALRQRVAIPLTGDEHAGVWRHQKKDGTVIEVEIVTHTLVFGGRHAKLVLAEDVTERHRAEEEIRQQARLLDLSYEAIFAWELDGGIVYWNRGCEELYGFTKDEAIGSDSHQLLRTAHPMPLRSFKYALERDGYWDGEIAHTTRAGRRITVESRHMLVQTPARRLVLETNRDVTARKQAEEALGESLRSKTEFLADVSHELRTPLTSIRVNAEVGLQNQRDCTHIAPLEEISRAARRMSRLVEDMLFLAHSDSGPPPLEPRRISLSPFLSGLSESAGALAGEYGASLDARISGEGEASLDPSRVEQAVLILVSNAAKYGPPGGPVTFSATASDEELCLIVEDRGPGISEEDLPYIFDRFYRGVARRSRSGSGLGLTIARTIAEAHGGRIEAENRPSGGARLSLYLPAGDDGQRPIAARPEKSIRRSNETRAN